MTDELARAEAEARLGIETAASAEGLRAVVAEALGKRSALARLHQGLGGLDAAERKAQGAALNEARQRLSSLAEARRAELEAAERRARLAAERMDLTEVLPRPGWGRLHPVTQTRQALEDVFVGMGYTVAEGPEVETDWYNFEALNFPPGHPARSMQDTLSLRLGEPESVVLRTHTSPVQVRVMQSQAPPIYAVMPGRCYRRDTGDARHLSPAFHQIEGLVVDRGITFGDLAGTIETFTGAYFGPNVTSRLRPAFFPFTEPSAEFEVTCWVCEGAGCRTCSHTGWIELGGCGMVDPNVFAAVGIDAEEWSGFAFGFGIDRLAMSRHDVDDIRQFVENDVRFLRQF